MKSITSRVSVGLWDSTSGPSLCSARSGSLPRDSPPSRPLCSRRDSVWRPSSVSVLSTRSRTAARPPAPPWQTCRRSISSWRSCSSPMTSLCLKKPRWARTPGTGAARKAHSTARTWPAWGASARAVPASSRHGPPGVMSCSGTSPGRPRRPPLPF